MFLFVYVAVRSEGYVPKLQVYLFGRCISYITTVDEIIVNAIVNTEMLLY